VRQRSILRFAAALALPLALVACGGDGGGGGGAPAAPQSVTLGFMGDLTGQNSGIVIPPRNGARLAIDEYNATNPSVKIELKEYDSQGVPDQATGLAQQAITTDKIVGLIGPAFSGESRQVGPILEEGKIPSISASATAVSLAEGGWKYWHRILPGDRIQGTGIGEFMARALNAKNAFVIHDNQEYSKGIADFVSNTLKGKGVTLGTDVIDPDGSDYSATVNRVRSANPDAIFYGGYYAQAGRLLKQLREGGVRARFVSGDGSLDVGLAKGAGAANVEGALVGCPCLIDPTGRANERSKKFADAYRAKFNTTPAIYAAEGYDSATAFIEAIKAGNTTTERINEFLRTIDVPGVTKQIKFQANGEPTAGDIYIYEFKGNSYSLLGKATEATVG
jgi:branched-chain amino acid transport system substrate-binding protein